MGFWQVDTDTLASGRFVVSPLAETLACLHTLYRGTTAHPAERVWLDAHRPAFQAMVAADPLTGPLLDAAMGLRTHWIADLLTPVPFEDAPSFEQELRRTRETPADRARANLVVSSGGPLPELLEDADIAGRLADVLARVWTATVAPTWERRRRIMEADVISRTAQLSRTGWAAALNDMRPGMRWLGDGRLQINVHDFPPRQTAGARLYFAPVTPARGWVAWDDTPRYAIVYPCSGVLADVDETTLPEPLARLLGTNRALILVLLDAPKSTTQLVALTDQTLGSVGRHLRILLDAGLVRRRRSGKSVLYYRTAGGDVLVEGASRPPET
ncbi:ArsR/SmtB family transcription factor [Catenulispora subtropica]|uniref:Winged helix-turn-helix domain-containing protein n=1 Tax=Catenulispora subtropica TaxID=450798 RepID=A0ABN2SMH7_9ACTN